MSYQALGRPIPNSTRYSRTEKESEIIGVTILEPKRGKYDIGS